ncbi:MAG: membrane protease YdiL (CAAX protease family) [Verrucomicrobiales bacterium]|jgi:membrane protease YdiL (CAAX protease family)
MTHWFPADGLAWRTLLFAASFEFGLGLVAWGIGKLIGVDVTQTALVSLRGMMTGVVATLPMLIVLACLLRWSIGPIAELAAKTRHFAQKFLAPCGIIGLAVISIGAGVGEEMLTRGLIHTVALEYFSPIVALLLTGFVFGLMHPVSISYVAIAGVIGVFLGVVWRNSGPDLAAPIVAHSLYDFVALMVLCRRNNSV